MTDVGEGAATPPKCPPHKWIIERDKNGDERTSTPAEQKANLDKEIADLKGSPSRAGQMRGKVFEKKAIEKNDKGDNIIAVSVHAKCDLCGIQQEIDILEKDKAVEAKSRNTKQVKKRSQQRHNYLDIQRQINEEMGQPADTKPLAKTDSSLPDAADTEALYKEKGFAVEPL
jgi:hypothetical protein